VEHSFIPWLLLRLDRFFTECLGICSKTAFWFNLSCLTMVSRNRLIYYAPGDFYKKTGDQALVLPLLTILSHIRLIFVQKNDPKIRRYLIFRKHSALYI